MVRTEGDKEYSPSNLRENPINRKARVIRESSDGYKFKRRVNILNNLGYFEKLRYLFDEPDNPKETKEKKDRFRGGGTICGKIRGIEARIELTKTNPGYLSVKTSEEDRDTAYNKILDDIISGRVKLQ